MMEDSQQMTGAGNSNPNEWVDAYGDYLFRYALIYVKDRQIAEDLVQDTFLAALQSRVAFCGRSSEKTWFVGILKHKIVDHFRRESKYSRIDDEETAPAGECFILGGRWAGFWNTAADPQNWHFDPSQTAEQKAFLCTLERCLSRLPPRISTVFVLREVQQLGTKEICELMSVSESNLWVMLHRARLYLRRCIEMNWLNVKREA